MAREDNSAAHSALNELCRNYWRPIYSFARYRGNTPHDAEDLTQAYFAGLLVRGHIQRADQALGRFRAFLIHDFKFFLSRQHVKQNAAKRGGKVQFFPLDLAWAESLHEVADTSGVDSDAYFDRQWALEVVRHARAAVAKDYQAQGRQALFDSLQFGLVSTPADAEYKKWECELGMNKGALKVALHRLRERFRGALEAQILETVASEAELKLEMHHLRCALAHSRSGT